jgi:hypothetical protein
MRSGRQLRQFFFSAKDARGIVAGVLAGAGHAGQGMGGGKALCAGPAAPAGAGRLDCTDERGIQRRDLPTPGAAAGADRRRRAGGASGKSLTDVLARMPADIRPGVQALSFHTLRWLGSATVARERLVPKPPAPNVDALLVTALALLWPGEPLPYAEHTLVDQAVTAAQRRMPAAAGFINAVLRRFLRERDALVQAVQGHAAGRLQPPAVVDRPHQGRLAAEPGRACSPPPTNGRR